ncbi:L-2-hydroxyglutarate oxidase [Ornithinibacillus gellani]|uniref:L-2-hydroxyglutarate oxidase n=1 Tax=Ornithinibacillus gellani TaxID=2293253 RepID=UPI000F4951EF|nr:L-2-hydroxyglutarate oxidase [Ornithinibacillus gellani]TQS74117.1 L-2-hydroxyglutarate oxidase [Ornithinibacillus gellani]
MKHYDYIIVGGGIIGLCIARELRLRLPSASICLLEKEADVARHASGRNSGVLHAGFYYTADSLKARFTKEGNQAMTRYCEANGLQINRCGKLVVAANEGELQDLMELKKRADRNGVQLEWVDAMDIQAIDPNVASNRLALYSPTTASVDPIEVCQKLKQEVLSMGVEIACQTAYVSQTVNRIKTNRGSYSFSYFINAAGLYADQVAKDFGFGLDYTMIPFKGMYMTYTGEATDISTNIYPVPDLQQPFLGVHFTKTVDGSIKVGPTATPALWRENYGGWQRLKWKELFRIVWEEARLFLSNSFQFRTFALEEMKKYRKAYFIQLARYMVKDLDWQAFKSTIQPGIRAQLLHQKTRRLEQDFIVEGDGRSIHVLNAVSPGFTCAFPFTRYVVDQVMIKQGLREKTSKVQIS